jgi:plasmid maintenance system antidote protein VapI
MPMKNPSHPGGFVLRQCIEPLGLTIKDAAAAQQYLERGQKKSVSAKRSLGPRVLFR